MGTSVYKTPRRKVAELEASFLHEFGAGTARLTQLTKKAVPSDYRLEQAVFAFKANERSALFRDSLQTLPSGAQVRAARQQCVAFGSGAAGR